MEHNSELDRVVIERIYATTGDDEEYIDINATVRPGCEDNPEDRFVVVTTPHSDAGVFMDLGDVISGTWTPAFARAVADSLISAANRADELIEAARVAADTGR